MYAELLKNKGKKAVTDETTAETGTDFLYFSGKINVAKKMLRDDVHRGVNVSKCGLKARGSVQRLIATVDHSAGLQRSCRHTRNKTSKVEEKKSWVWPKYTRSVCIHCNCAQR